MALSDQRITEVVLQRFPGVKFIYRFGSYGSKHQTTASDLDLAIYPEGELSDLERIETQMALGADLDIDVDLINLASCSTIIAAQVVNHGECIYTTNQEFSDLYAIRVITMALDLQYKLKGYLEDAKKRGSIY